eukprot:scaffold20882_cov71-Phaeocystis_antarctica.AAC.10
MPVRGSLRRRLTPTRPSCDQVHCGHQGTASRREGGKPPRWSRAIARLKECPLPANPRACRHGARPMHPRSDWLYETLNTPAAQRQERARLEHRERSKAHGKDDRKAAG